MLNIAFHLSGPCCQLPKDRCMCGAGLFIHCVCVCLCGQVQGWSQPLSSSMSMSSLRSHFLILISLSLNLSINACQGSQTSCPMQHALTLLVLDTFDIFLCLFLNRRMFSKTTMRRTASGVKTDSACWLSVSQYSSSSSAV